MAAAFIMKIYFSSLAYDYRESILKRRRVSCSVMRSSIIITFRFYFSPHTSALSSVKYTILHYP